MSNANGSTTTTTTTVTTTTSVSVATEAPQTTSPVPTVQPIEPNTYGTLTTEENAVHVVTLNTNATSTTNSPRTRVNSKTTRTEDTSLSPSATTVRYKEDFIDCTKVSHPFENVNIFPNGTIYVIPYEIYYERSEYLISDNQVWVCAFFINSTTTKAAKFSPTLGYITVIGLSISVMCLILHLTVFLFIPDLQNLSTRNLSSFAVALLLGYLCFTIGNIKSLSKMSCTFIAIATCYFFLVTFFWMNAMAFDVWRTLRLATRELRVSSGKQWKRFILYSAYAWGLPSAVLSVALVMDNVDGVPKDFKPGFGVRLCWFSERNSLLIFFGAPLMIVILTNIGFFVSSAKMIISTSHATSTNHSTSTRRNFKLYLRLAVMMGLTWTFGTVASYLDLETLWYIFVVLNTLQGLFVFVAFTCNQKVRKHLVDRFRSVGKGRQAYRTSSLNSGSGINFPSNNVGSKTNLTHLGGSKMSLVSEKGSQVSSLTSTPVRSLSPFKQLQAGMETLY